MGWAFQGEEATDIAEADRETFVRSVRSRGVRSMAIVVHRFNTQTSSQKCPADSYPRSQQGQVEQLYYNVLHADSMFICVRVHPKTSKKASGFRMRQHVLA